MDDQTERAKSLQLKWQLVGSRYFVMQSDDTIVASERALTLALECAIARVEAGVFKKTSDDNLDSEA